MTRAVKGPCSRCSHRPTAHELHYQIAGKGDPVLLIMGLGMASTAWWRTVPVLAKRLRVITFDNRGAGRSDAPRGPYTLRQLAADAVAVLDAAGEERAHVYGFSLGGMIAQELALRHPERVNKLVLGATTPGGDITSCPTRTHLASSSAEPRCRPRRPSGRRSPTTTDRTHAWKHADRIAADIAQRLLFPPSTDGYKAQLGAAWRFDAVDRLAEVTHPHSSFTEARTA